MWVNKLLSVIIKTVIIIVHNFQVIKYAKYVFDIFNEAHKFCEERVAFLCWILLGFFQLLIFWEGKFVEFFDVKIKQSLKMIK